MNGKVMWLLFVFWGIVSGNAVDEFSASSGRFSTKLYKNIAGRESGNIIMSPLSIQSAVSLLYFGATGATETEMKQSLEYNRINKTQAAESFSQLSDKIKSTDGLDIANKIFIRNGLSVKPSFNEIARESFSSETQSVNFQDKIQAAAIINNWVESKTNNKIKDLVKSDSLTSDTTVVLVNAIYFKGIWAYKFNKLATIPMPFYLNEQDTVETDFMSLKKNLPYAQLPELGATALELPYKDSDISMMIILPDSKTGLLALENKINELNLFQVSSRFSNNQKVVVLIPKFKIETEIDLKDPLTELGMKRIFSNNAEFNNLVANSAPLKISKAVHKAFIEVNEEGTEAAAATGMQGASFSKFRESFVRFQADRPFLFALKTSTKILFMGRYVQPNK
jgi:serpin B